MRKKSTTRKRRVQVGVRIDPDTKEWFEYLAEQEERTLSNMIAVTLEGLRLKDEKHWRSEVFGEILAAGKRKKTKKT